MSMLPANHSSRPDEIPFQRKTGKHVESDPAELMWKIKDKDELPPDNMRDYLYKIIRHECSKPFSKSAAL
ncbi:hypothetical protein EC988_007868 [Linderina pennispora]|nr:hypothetical protein EC988_007868 [Linderina pennispora]